MDDLTGTEHATDFNDPISRLNYLFQ